MHRDHLEPNGGVENGEGVLWGELSDYNEEEDEEGEGEGAEHLLMCCGEKRPRGKAVSVVVKLLRRTGSSRFMTTCPPCIRG
jgi:hypothetical protein